MEAGAANRTILTGGRKTGRTQALREIADVEGGIVIQPADPAAPVRSCTAHCATCRRHFIGNGAFDRHRKGDTRGGDRTRYCADPAEDSWFERVDGKCSISAPGTPEQGVTLWRRAGAAERVSGLARRAG